MSWKGRLGEGFVSARQKEGGVSLKSLMMSIILLFLHSRFSVPLFSRHLPFIQILLQLYFLYFLFYSLLSQIPNELSEHITWTLSFPLPSSLSFLLLEIHLSFGHSFVLSFIWEEFSRLYYLLPLSCFLCCIKHFTKFKLLLRFSSVRACWIPWITWRKSARCW